MCVPERDGWGDWGQHEVEHQMLVSMWKAVQDASASQRSVLRDRCW